jgi:hypothetical protein
MANGDDPIGAALRESGPVETAIQQERLRDATDELAGRGMDAAMGGRPITNFLEFLLIFLVLMGVTIAALVWQLLFGEDEPSVNQTPEEEHHHLEGSETPTLNLGAQYRIVLSPDSPYRA